MFRHSSVVGTPSYMAPETIKKERYNSGIDWWSFGVTVYESSVGDRLFQGGTREAIYANIVKLKFDLSKLKEINEDIYDMCSKLLLHDATRRLGVEDINHLKQHSYFNGINWDSVSTEEMKFHPPPHQPLHKSEDSLQKDRLNFYGREDPDCRGEYADKKDNFRSKKGLSPISPALYRSKRQKRGGRKSIGWSSYNSLSVLIIDEASNEKSLEE